MASGQSQVLYAPSQEPSRGVKSVFLAGATTKVDKEDWREVLSSSLSKLPITIYNPFRPDWDSTWYEDVECAPYREQTLWELEKQAESDLVVVYFHPATQAPVSLLEFGLSAQIPGKVLAVCPPGFWKRGNVQVVCHKYGIDMLNDINELAGAIEKKLAIG